MSKSVPVHIGDRLYWSLDDSLMIWLAYLVEQIRATPDAQEWLKEAAEGWAICASVSDLGFVEAEMSTEQRAELLAVAISARRRVIAEDGVALDRLRSWWILPELLVSDGFSRTGDKVDLDRILQTVAWFIKALDGTMPPDPPGGGHWYVGHGMPPTVL